MTPAQSKTLLSQVLAVVGATEYRQRILAARDDKPYEQLRQELDVADEALSLARLTGDCVIAAFFSAAKDRERVAKLDTLGRQLVKYIGAKSRIEDRQPLTEAVNELRGLFPNSHNPHPISPFHWQIEFPEVFTIDAKGKHIGGFDAIVGNPPFLGGTRISEVAGMSYFAWLVCQFPPCEHHCDLVAYFFRRAFALLRRGGCLGLIATNTISQGDTREGGLRTILLQSGEIYEARRRYRWPGLAAVIVSVVHISKRASPHPKLLDGKPVSRISAYIFDSGVDESPVRLTGNPYFSIGSKIYGQGFLFDDTDAACSPTALRDDILARHPHWATRIPPYIGGEEINTHPEQQYHRYAIYLSDLQEADDLDAFPELRRIVESKVLPERQQLGDNPNNVPLKRRWWAYQAHRPELYARLRLMQRALVSSQVSAQFAFAMLPTNWMFAHTANVFCIEEFSGFAAIQSRVHEVWARFFASSMKDDMRYTPSDCFETFPFPAGVLERAACDSSATDNRQLTTLEAAGSEYYEFRAALMVRNNEGLTKTYNRFHDPNETSSDILTLRELHAAMDRAVLEAYGWHDLAERATCVFLLDYEDEEEDEGEPSPQPSPRGRGRKRPWRYRWPDDFRDEVLARLLELNKQRAEQERLAGGAASAAEKKPKRKTAGKNKAPKSSNQPDLLGM